MTTLIAHFVRMFVRLGVLTQTGADSLIRLLLGAAAAVLAVGFAATRVFVGRYEALGLASSAEPYRRALLADDLLIVGLPMLLTALVTVLISESLYPSSRDFRILGPLPVRKGDLFAAKLIALAAFVGAFITVVHAAILPVVLMTSINRWRDDPVLTRVIVWAVASVGGSVFAFLAVTAIVGVMTLALSRSRLERLNALIKGGLLALLVSCLPLLLRLPLHGNALANGDAWMEVVPPAWFVGLGRTLLGRAGPSLVRLAIVAEISIATAAAIVAVSYVLLFRHFERFMLRPFARPSRDSAPALSRHSRSTPAFLAVFRFTATTMARSQFHQSVLIGVSGCGLALAFSGGGAWAPFALMFACAVGARASLALPLEHGANWIFRITEDQTTRADQLRAVDRVVTIWLAGPATTLAIATLWLPLGLPGAIATSVVALVALVSVHTVLFDWRRIPFTSSYLPGKHFFVHTFVLACVAWVAFTGAGVGLVRIARQGPTAALAITVGLAGLALTFKRRRMARWQRTPLMFEDEFPDRQLQLDLQR